MSVIKKLDSEPVVAFRVAYAKLPGSDAMCALFLSQVSYWCARSEDGVVWITHQAMYEQTGMTRKQQDRAASYWVTQGVMTKFIKGIPPKIHYFVDFEKLEKLILDAQFQQNDMSERGNLVVRKGQQVLSERDKTSREDYEEIQTTEQQPAAPSPSAPESEKALRAGSIAGKEVASCQMPVPELTPVQAQALDIYDAYPRKVGKDAAIKAIVKAIGKIGFDRLLASVHEYRSFTDRWLDDRKQFIPHPATWMNKGCYDDDRSEWRRNCKPGSSREQVKAMPPTPTDHWLTATARSENEESAQYGRGMNLANDDWMNA